MLKVFVLRIFKFLSRLFSHIGKRLDKKTKNDLKIYDGVTYCETKYSKCQNWQKL